MFKWSITALFLFLLVDQARACSCSLRSDDPADYIDQAEYIFFGDPIYMMVEETEPDQAGYVDQIARTVFLVSKTYKGNLKPEFRGELPEYFERVERVNDGRLISVFHGFRSQAACDIRFEFQAQLVMTFEMNNRLQTGYCTMRLLENSPEREGEFLNILNNAD